jgi:hypothetical protein
LPFLHPLNFDECCHICKHSIRKLNVDVNMFIIICVKHVFS